ncbi:MAG: hypothetical protein KGI64_03830 [Xanthomonadaceae bacterium]|nr:hypothetical protein [Xanthomonadaceae bacterium]MDE2083972.1 hypothetical protein [Xanthomonadaceae bacterium]
MPLRAFLAALVLGVFASQARATDVVGYGEAYNALYSVDLTARTAVLIGGSGLINGQQTPSNITGLTFNPAGILYAVWDAGQVKILVTVNKGTGIVTPVGTFNFNGNTQFDLALAFTSDGSLWMSSSNGQLWQVDPATATATPVANLGIKITGLTAKGMALYGTGGLGNNNFYSIDAANGTATLIGSYGSTANPISFVSPAFDSSGELWGILDYIPPLSTTYLQWSDLAQISLSTGALTDLGSITPPSSYSVNSPTFQNLSYVGIRGLAIAPNAFAGQNIVSTPALSWRAIAALIVLTLLLGGTWLRRRRPSC